MGNKTYSIALIVGLAITIFVALELDRVIGQKKLNAILEIAKTELKLTENDRISGCDYQDGWYLLGVSKNIFLMKDKNIYFADLGKHNSQNDFKRWPKIELQPNNSPQVDFYYFYKYCVW